MEPPRRWITHDGLEDLLDLLALERELFAPVRVEGELVFRRVRSSVEIARDYVNTLVPPRDLFLPTPERLASYQIEDGVPRLMSEGDDEFPERVLFGVRSCDVAGFAYLERFLSGEPFGRPDTADGPFLRRREAATVISVVCQEPGPTCMCVCCKGGPALESRYDWQLTALPMGWLVEIGSARGRRLAEAVPGVLRDPPGSALAEKEERVRAAVARFRDGSPHRVQTMAAARMISTGRLPRSFWDGLGERCMECGGCAFVCPTCSCFNVADVTAAGEAGFADPEGGLVPAAPGGVTLRVPDGAWDRLRLRDNCILAGFVREAGGGYPRWTCGERCVTRFFHKLSQQFHERMGAPGCTGCGRCVETCMSGIGIDRVSELMTETLTGQPARPSPAPRPPRVRPAAGSPGLAGAAGRGGRRAP
jgi:ferredoxin